MKHIAFIYEICKTIYKHMLCTHFIGIHGQGKSYLIFRKAIHTYKSYIYEQKYKQI